MFHRPRASRLSSKQAWRISPAPRGYVHPYQLPTYPPPSASFSVPFKEMMALTAAEAPPRRPSRQVFGTVCFELGLIEATAPTGGAQIRAHAEVPLLAGQPPVVVVSGGWGRCQLAQGGGGGAPPSTFAAVSSNSFSGPSFSLPSPIRNVASAMRGKQIKAAPISPFSLIDLT